MSIALIDNSTLSSIQRVLGHIEIKDRSIVDGDIAGFESLINAILFYNEIIVIDDYKKEFSDERKKLFSFIRFVDPKIIPKELVADSVKEAKKIEPCIRNGEFVDEAYHQFFDLLKINIKCTWDVSMSIYYLTLKMLGKPDTPEFKKYSTICHNIFSELNENHKNTYFYNSQVTLLDKSGRKIRKDYIIPGSKMGGGEIGGVSRGLDAFVASLNWITFRSIFYTFLADYLKADVFLHPIRQNFQIFYMNKSNRFEHNFNAEVLRKIENNAVSEITEIISSTKNFGVNISTPLFVGSIINKTKNPSEIIDYALELREQKEFLQAREQLSEIRNLLDENGFNPEVSKMTQKIVSDVNKTFFQIRNSYGLNTQHGNLTSKIINVVNACLSPQIPTEITESKWFNQISQLIPKNSFSCIYKNLSADLLNIAKLGENYDLLTSNIKVNPGLRTHNPKTEDYKYKDYHSQWKSPMV